jgi:hypothetical protein
MRRNRKTSISNKERQLAAIEKFCGELSASAYDYRSNIESVMEQFQEHEPDITEHILHGMDTKFAPKGLVAEARKAMVLIYKVEEALMDANDALEELEQHSENEQEDANARLLSGKLFSRSLPKWRKHGKKGGR